MSGRDHVAIPYCRGNVFAGIDSHRGWRRVEPGLSEQTRTHRHLRSRWWRRFYSASNRAGDFRAPGPAGGSGESNGRGSCVGCRVQGAARWLYAACQRRQLLDHPAVAKDALRCGGSCTDLAGGKGYSDNCRASIDAGQIRKGVDRIGQSETRAA